MPTPSAAPVGASSNLRSLKSLTFNQVSFPFGAVQTIAVSPKDGSLYAVTANSPSGYAPDGSIYQLVGGTWTQIPGVASSIAVDANGILYAVVKSGTKAVQGQAYAYVPPNFQPGAGATPIPSATGPSWYALVTYDGKKGTSSGQAPTPQPAPAGMVIAANLGGAEVPVIVASAPPGGNGAVWAWGSQPGNPYFAWQQLPGAGTSLARNNIAAAIAVPTPVSSGAPLASWLPGGFFMVESHGKLFKYNGVLPAGAAPWQDLPRNGTSPEPPALGMVASNGLQTSAPGSPAPISYNSSTVFALPAGATNANPVQVLALAPSIGYFFPTGSQPVSFITTGGLCNPVSGVCTAPLPLYGLGPFATPAPVIGFATPGPPPLTVPLTIQIDAKAISTTPKMNPSQTYVSIIDQPVMSSQGTTTWVQVTNPSGATANWNNDGKQVAAAIPFCSPCPPTSPGQAATSQRIQLPWLRSARIYISYNPAAGSTPLPITLSSGPAPWNGDGSQNVYFDYIEYTWVPVTRAGFAGDPNIYVDTTQVNEMGLPIELQLKGSDGATQTTGVLGGAFAQVNTLLTNAPTVVPSPGAPSVSFWQQLTGQWPYRILSPDGPAFSSGMPPTGGVNLTPGALDGVIRTAWDSYQSPNSLTIADPGGELVGHDVVGRVDANENFVFSLDSLNGAVVGEIPSPFNPAYQYPGGVIDKKAYAGTWGAATQSVVQQNGPFLLPASITVGPTPTTYTFRNSQYPLADATIGNKVSTAINRGIFGYPAYTTISCTAQPALFPVSGAAFYNYYAYAVYKTLAQPQYGYNQSYSIPYNDQCGSSTTISSANPGGLTAVVHQF